MKTEKKQLSFSEWLEKTINKTFKKYLTIPKHITQLPCGCKRDISATPFYIKKIQKGWIHWSCRSDDNLITLNKEVANQNHIHPHNCNCFSCSY